MHLSYLMPYIVLLAFFAVAMFMVRGIDRSYSNMVAANHSVPWHIAAPSIMATFAAPIGLLHAGGFGYSLGLPGVTVYVVAYMLIYFLYAWFAGRIKQLYPNMLTISDVIDQNIGSRTGMVLRLQYTVGPIYGVLLNLTGLKIITAMWGFSMLESYVFMTVSVLAVLIYCWNGGLASSIRTDLMQAWLLIGSTLVIMAAVAFGVQDSVGLDQALNKPWNLDLLINPGLLFVFILGGAIFSDVEMHNRAAAMKNGSQVRLAFGLAAFLAAFIMVAYGVIGMMPTEVLANKDQAILGPILDQGHVISAVFAVALIALLVANIDSAVVANGIMLTHEWTKKQDINTFRIGMVLTGVISLALTFLDFSIMQIIMVWSCYRLATLPAVVSFASGHRFNDKTWVYFFSVAFVLGLGVTFYAFLHKLPLAFSLTGYAVIILLSSLGIWGRHNSQTA